MTPEVFTPDTKSQLDIRRAAGAVTGVRTVQRGPTGAPIFGKIIRGSTGLIIEDSPGSKVKISGFVVECDEQTLKNIAKRHLFNQLVSVRERIQFERLPK